MVERSYTARPVKFAPCHRIVASRLPTIHLFERVADPADWDKAIKDLGPLAKTDEDILLGVLFPMQAKEFLTLRENGGIQ